MKRLVLLAALLAGCSDLEPNCLDVGERCGQAYCAQTMFCADPSQDGRGCVPMLKAGASCEANRQCRSGACTDRVCVGPDAACVGGF